MRLLLLLLSFLFIDDFDTSLIKNICVNNKTIVNSTSSLSVNLRRKKRSLTFPKGSAFVLTITLLKAIQIREPTNWNLDLEFDMIWPIPEGISAQDKSPIRRPILIYRRHRRELYANFELALDSQGLPGNQCILRTICESKFILNPPGVSLIEDILRIIFNYPRSFTSNYDAYDEAQMTKNDCDILFPCPFSLLDLLLNYHNDVSNYK